METMYGSFIDSITTIRQAISKPKYNKGNLEHFSYFKHISRKIQTRFQKRHDFRGKDVCGYLAENMITSAKHDS